jgi:hypothetical protein
LVEDHVRVDDPPLVIEVGLAEIVAVAAGVVDPDPRILISSNNIFG